MCEQDGCHDEKDDRWFSYDVVAEDPSTHARAGVLHTPHGDVPTPIFMPVGTKGTVKGILPQTLEQVGAHIVLANTYHLAMRPGVDVVSVSIRAASTAARRLPGTTTACSGRRDTSW